MQDIYAFDVGDFGKLGLLRLVWASTGLRLGVLWWKTSLGTAGADGKHVSYLEEPAFRDCDPRLWDGMRQFFDPSARRIVSLHPLLPGDTLFHDVPVPPGGHRKQWFNDAKSKVRGSAVVFCDPDNGVTFDGHYDSGRHIHLEEIRDLYRSGHSVIVYHTPNRSTTHRTQVESGLEHFHREIAGLGSSWAAHFRRGSSRVFFVLVQQSHAALMDIAIRRLQSSAWTRDGHFEIVTRDMEPERPDSKATDRRGDCQSKGAGTLLPSPTELVQAVRAESTRLETDVPGEAGDPVLVVLNDNGGLNTAANPWLEDVDVPCRLSAGDGLTFRVEAAFSGRNDMYRI